MVFGLGSKKIKKSSKKAGKKTSSKSNEAKEVLARMEAKKKAGDCAFC